MTIHSSKQSRPTTMCGSPHGMTRWVVALLLVIGPVAGASAALEPPADPVGYVAGLCGAVAAPSAMPVEALGEWRVTFDGTAEGVAFAFEQNGYVVEIVEVPKGTPHYVKVIGDGFSRWTDGAACWDMKAKSDCAVSRCLERVPDPQSTAGPKTADYAMADAPVALPSNTDTTCVAQNDVCDADIACCAGYSQQTVEVPILGTDKTRDVCKCL